MTSFQETGYAIIKNVIDPNVANFISKEFLLEKCFYTTLNKPFDNKKIRSDNLVTDYSFVSSKSLFLETLLLEVQPIVEQVTGKKLYPTYSYGRIYYQGATMPAHRDRPACEYSVTVTLDTDGNEPWEIFMENLQGNITPVKLNVGDICIYKGIELTHHRETPLKTSRQIQAFLHYVDTDGLYSEWKWDKRSHIGVNGFSA